MAGGTDEDPEAGWYRDPATEAPFRYFNGVCWTGWTQTSLTSVLPPPPSVGAPPSSLGDTAWLEAFDAPGASARAKASEIQAAAAPRGFLARLLGGPTADRNWTQGAIGEERVAQRLAKLPQPPWTVLHDLPIGNKGANIDHLVIGPGGVYTINTKNLSGRIWVGGGTFMQNGRRLPYIPAASREATRATRCLKKATGIDVPVMGLIVVMANEVTVKRQPDDVRVLTRRQVIRWISRRPTVVQQHHLDGPVHVARQRSTWV